MTSVSPEQQLLIDKAAFVAPIYKFGKPSYPLDKFLWLESQPLDALVSQLADEITAGRTGRKRKEDAEEKLRFFVKLLLLNLLQLHKLPRKTLLALPKGAGTYTVKDRYSQPLLSYTTLCEAYDQMLALGYVEETNKGFWDKLKNKGKVTRIDATAMLLERLDALFPQPVIIFIRHPNEETIVHKNTDKREVEYKNTPYSNAARDNLKVINVCLGRHWYDLEMTNQQFAELEITMLGKHDKDARRPPVINFTARSLYRVFNNGNAKHQKENFNFGGRFYGGWWENLPSSFRRYITINHKHTVEIDYSNLHPQMLYAKEGLPLTEDAYTIDGIPRDTCKLAFSKLLNGKLSPRKPKDYDELKTRLTWQQVVKAVEERHAPIKKYFGSGYGLRLQRIDADILEEILLHYASNNIPCLPIHDSIIMHYAYADELKDLMVRVYHKQLGSEIKTKEDNNYDWFVTHYTGQGENITPIEEIAESDNNSQYYRRWESWVSQVGNN